MPVPIYTPVVPSTTNELPPLSDASFAWGSKEAWYTFTGEQDGMHGAGPNSVAAGDELWQSYYDNGWAMGHYFRTMSGVNGFSI